MKKLLSITLTVTLVMTMLAGCGDSGGGTYVAPKDENDDQIHLTLSDEDIEAVTSSTDEIELPDLFGAEPDDEDEAGEPPIQLTLSTDEDAAALLAAEGIVLPPIEEAVGANSTIIWYSDHDFNSYSSDEIEQIGYYTFTQNYGGNVKWIEYSSQAEKYDQLANLVLSGNSPDFMQADTDLFPISAVDGILQPVDNYIDYNDPLWSGMKSFAEKYFSAGGQNYAMITDVSPSYVVAYNRRIMEEWGFDDPAELYWNDEWTWDVFYEMCYWFTDPDEDRYAIDGTHFADAFIMSSGFNILEYNSNLSSLSNNLDSPNIERAANFINQLVQEGNFYPAQNNGSIRNGVVGSGMREGQCLFQVVTLQELAENISNFGNVSDWEVMFVPMPRDENGDGEYYMPATPQGYFLAAGAQNPDGAALLAMCDRYKVLDPTAADVDRYRYENTYNWTYEMLEMYNECKRLATHSPVISYGYGATSGYGADIGGVISDIYEELEMSGATWSQIKAAYDETLDYYVADFN